MRDEFYFRNLTLMILIFPPLSLILRSIEIQTVPSNHHRHAFVPRAVIPHPLLY